MSNKLLIYELNEIPKRLLDYYVKLRPSSNLAFIYQKGIKINTLSTDEGELHPWTTWPTFYRGVDNTIHKIRFLNQDKNIAKNYPPAWEILNKNNISIGIFGSLQSYPPIKDKNIKFYLPDTFSPSSDAYPKYLSRFQKFNLNICSNNSVISRRIRFLEIYNFFLCVINLDFDFKSLFILLNHLIKEFFNKLHKKRRSLLQPVLGFSVFKKLLYKHKPDFCTFYSNHLAGMMHRYWFDIFPNDFKNYFRKADEFNKKSIIKALDIADNQIGELIKFSLRNSYELWIASSMGQKAFVRENREKLFINDLNLFLKSIGLNSNNYSKLPSMYPDLNLRCESKNHLDKLIKTINVLRTEKGKKILKLRYKPVNNTVNLKIENHEEKFSFIMINNKKLDLKKLGANFLPRMTGSGYHIPEGILLIYGNKNIDIYDKKEIQTKEVLSIVLKKFNLN